MPHRLVGAVDESRVMVETRNDFDARLKTLGRKHRAMARGSETHMRRDGLIVVRPSRRRAPGRGNPMRTFIFLFLGFFVIKGFLLASIGEAGYEERLARLKAGTALEQVGAAVMRPDRVSIVMATMWANVMRG